MTNADAGWQAVFDATHRAVADFASVELASMARRIVSALQRMPATGIFGDDYSFRSLWDEYCHEVQNGPSYDLEWAWDATIAPFIQHQIDRLPVHARLLISIGAEYERSDDDNISAHYDPDLVHDAAKSCLGRMAARRSMDRFNCY